MGGLKGSNINHNNLPNSEPGAGAGDSAAVGGLSVAMVTLINADGCCPRISATISALLSQLWT